MIATQRKGREKQGGQMPFLAFGLGAFVVAFTLLTAVPLHADTFYSGAAVNSDGSVYSWGVTSACSMSSHTTHMGSTLTSPKGRQASGSASDGCSSRVDLYLAADLTDEGTYSVVSYSWAFCPVLGRWFWNGCGSTASLVLGVSHNCFYKPIYAGGGYCSYVRMDPCACNCTPSTARIYVGGQTCPAYEYGIEPWAYFGGAIHCLGLTDNGPSDPSCTCFDVPPFSP